MRTGTSRRGDAEASSKLAVTVPFHSVAARSLARTSMSTELPRSTVMVSPSAGSSTAEMPWLVIVIGAPHPQASLLLLVLVPLLDTDAVHVEVKLLVAIPLDVEVPVAVFVVRPVAEVTPVNVPVEEIVLVWLTVVSAEVVVVSVCVPLVLVVPLVE